MSEDHAHAIPLDLVLQNSKCNYPPLDLVLQNSKYN